MGDKLTDTFMSLFCEKNSDGTKNLRLQGKEMQNRINKRIKDKDMTKIAHFMLENKEIVKLDLCYNKVGDEGIQDFVEEYLSQENNLLHLNLAGCNLTWSGVQKLASVSNSFHLKTLRLNGNKIGTDGGKFAAMILNDNATLEHLDMGDADQTMASVLYFCAALRSDMGQNKTLKVLDLSRIIPHSPIAQLCPGEMAETIGTMLSVNDTLIELHLQKCEFDGHDIELLLIGLKRNNNLLMLDLGYNRFGDHGTDLLSKWLKTRPPLLGLNLAGCGIKNFGARAISFGMPFSRVRLLDISNNKIEDEGLVDILNSIKKPYILRLFFIWGNALGPKSKKIIQRMLVSGVLEQENIDIKLYIVDDVLYHAYYPADRYKHKYYSVQDYGCAVELRIKRNVIEPEYAKPRAKIKFKFYPRLPDYFPPKKVVEVEEESEAYEVEEEHVRELEEFYKIHEEEEEVIAVCLCDPLADGTKCICDDCNMFVDHTLRGSKQIVKFSHSNVCVT